MAENDDESGPPELLMMSILSVEFPALDKAFLSLTLKGLNHGSLGPESSLPTEQD